MGRSPRTFVASCRRARRRAGDALWAAGYPARRGLHSARARLAGWRLGRPDALVPLQVRWARASGDRRAAAAVLALLPLSLAAALGVSLFNTAEREPRSGPEAVRVSEGVLPEAVEWRPASEPKPRRRRPHKAAPGPAAAGPAGVGVRSAATGLTPAPGAPSIPVPDDAPDAGVVPDARGAPNDSPSPPRDFDNGGRRNVAPRAHVPFGGGPGTRDPPRRPPRRGGRPPLHRSARRRRCRSPMRRAAPAAATDRRSAVRRARAEATATNRTGTELHAASAGAAGWRCQRRPTCSTHTVARRPRKRPRFSPAPAWRNPPRSTARCAGDCIQARTVRRARGRHPRCIASASPRARKRPGKSTPPTCASTSFAIRAAACLPALCASGPETRSGRRPCLLRTSLTALTSARSAAGARTVAVAPVGTSAVTPTQAMASRTAIPDLAFSAIWRSER